MRVVSLAVVVLVVTAGCAGVDTTTDEPTTTMAGTESTGESTTAPTAGMDPTVTPTSTASTPPTESTPAPTTPNSTTPHPTTTVADDGTEVPYFPVPAGAVETDAPGPDPPVSNTTRIQAYEAPLDPPNATDWYRYTLTNWTLRTVTESHTTRFGWMNRLAFTHGDETLFVYVTSADAGSEITLARGTGNVGMGGWVFFDHLGWEPVSYTTSPIPHETVDQVVPLGNLAPPGHTFPTDHAYLFVPDADRPAPVVAPADGVVTWVTASSLGDPPVDDYSVTIQHSNVHVTKLGHLSSLDPAFVDRLGGLGTGRTQVALRVSAGDRIGTAPMTYSTALDWWTLDYTRSHDGFAHPEYYGDAVHAMPFLDYVSPDLRAAYEPKLVREADPRFGKIDYDQQGRLVGNWFLGAAPLDQWNRTGHLAFVYSVRDPDALRVAVGGTVLQAGLYAVAENSSDPATITADSGPTVYHLQHAYGSGQVADGVVATLLVEVVGPNEIRVQGFDGRVENPEFNDDAHTYVR